MPPPAVTLHRISLALGLKPDAAASPDRVGTVDPARAMEEAMAAGLPICRGRPDDPILAFLDPPPP